MISGSELEHIKIVINSILITSLSSSFIVILIYLTFFLVNSNQINRLSIRLLILISFLNIFINFSYYLILNTNLDCNLLNLVENFSLNLYCLFFLLGGLELYIVYFKDYRFNFIEEILIQSFTLGFAILLLIPNEGFKLFCFNIILTSKNSACNLKPGSHLFLLLPLTHLSLVLAVECVELISSNPIELPISLTYIKLISLNIGGILNLLCVILDSGVINGIAELSIFRRFGGNDETPLNDVPSTSLNDIDSNIQDTLLQIQIG
ncbi:hypothetical protein CONCODRAFT_14295 [Conidiobolus coronatus NRRL 28638]|uniref:Uncharacterized protein n=1 Tax=Conidiobolus coronatus (strain ATCC 28846 / CBS 209.66 / NRRL 28638) TaxID=796925 RepID=A0A137NP87_CONC2|nr:hypothetical protein CONCODRAFT_14295 [Conidiobolus coronatus NRRL 28638]|eukprot:KXN64560.1 hypothetical protein CONCODRAFT_14295 [Conidiobolus coronatus NRRL 28638]